jgi:aldose 1-epimerase
MSLDLAAGGWAARLLPEQGAAFGRLTRDGQDVLAPVPDGADPNTAMAGAFWMAPWTNRLNGGRVGPTARCRSTARRKAPPSMALRGTGPGG